MSRFCEARQIKGRIGGHKEGEPEGTTVRGTVSKWSVGKLNPASLTISGTVCAYLCTLLTFSANAGVSAAFTVCSKVETNGVGFGILDGTFMSETGASLTCN